ncbi:MAG: pantoate kinase [Candidatus Saliniplasma sp.]
MTSRAFCPGHITGFFTLSDSSKEPMRKTGSRGAGFSIELGVTAEVSVGEKGWVIEVDGKRTSFPTVEKTLFNIAQGGEVFIETEIPFSQGFGLSGACALSAGMAALDDLGEDPKDAVEYAHSSEVFCRTGLGDVIAQSVGGFEIRVKEGLPPDGEIKKEEIDRELIIAVLGQPLITPDILNDPLLSEWIKLFGNDCMDEFLPDNGFDKFLDLSLEFAENTKFIKSDIGDAIDAVRDHGKGSMSMIGNSVFFFGDIETIKEILEEQAGAENVYLTRIDNKGARIID